jgi:hypothetical protein
MAKIIYKTKFYNIHIGKVKEYFNDLEFSVMVLFCGRSF